MYAIQCDVKQSTSMQIEARQSDVMQYKCIK